MKPAVILVLTLGLFLVAACTASTPVAPPTVPPTPTRTDVELDSRGRVHKLNFEPGQEEVTFTHWLTEANLLHGDEAPIIAAARAQCDRLRAGADLPTTLTELLPTYDDRQSLGIRYLAVLVYCPEFTDDITAYEDAVDTQRANTTAPAEPTR